MKRSELNNRIKEAIEFIESMNFKLPPFAYWNPEEWNNKGKDFDEIRDNMLGWDITDFGSGDFEKTGLMLFTLRNGNPSDSRYAKPYAEKLMIALEDQVTPMHFHWHKMEDIINRGGGNLLIQVYNSTEDDSLDTNTVPVSSDGHSFEAEAGSVITLRPGQSITLSPRMYHRFWAQKGYGKVLLGEVSMVNDDRSDNRFYSSIGRFPAIEEDEEPLYLLCNEYPQSIKD